MVVFPVHKVLFFVMESIYFTRALRENCGYSRWRHVPAPEGSPLHPPQRPWRAGSGPRPFRPPCGVVVRGAAAHKEIGELAGRAQVRKHAHERGTGVQAVARARMSHSPSAILPERPSRGTVPANVVGSARSTSLGRQICCAIALVSSSRDGGAGDHHNV